MENTSEYLEYRFSTISCPFVCYNLDEVCKLELFLLSKITKNYSHKRQANNYILELSSDQQTLIRHILYSRS